MMAVVMARSSSRAEQKDATHARLLRVARRVFVRHGYDAASIALVCREAKVTHGALYHHFPSKDALFAAVVGAVFSSVAERVSSAAASEHGWAQVEAACAAYLTACSDPEVQSIVFRDGPRVMARADFDAIDHAVNAPLVDGLIQGWMSQGLLAPWPVSLLARTLGAAFAEAGLLIREAEAPEHVHAQLSQLLMSWVSVLRRAPEPSAAPRLPTARLLLYPWSPADVAALQSLLSRPEIARQLFEGGAGLDAAIRASVAAFARGELGLWLAKTDGSELIGVAGFISGELVVATAPSSTRRGYGFEMAQAVLVEARARKCARIGATVDEANAAALRLLEKLGFVRVGALGSRVEHVLPASE